MASGVGLGAADPDVMAAIERGNAVVFLDVALGEGANAAELGRVKLELFVKDVSAMCHLLPYSLLPSLISFVSLFGVLNSVPELVKTFVNSVLVSF